MKLTKEGHLGTKRGFFQSPLKLLAGRCTYARRIRVGHFVALLKTDVAKMRWTLVDIRGAFFKVFLRLHVPVSLVSVN